MGLLSGLVRLVMCDFCWDGYGWLRGTSRDWYGWLCGTSVRTGKAGYVGLRLGLVRLVRLFFIGISKVGACTCALMCVCMHFCL